MEPIITTDIVVAYSQCPRKAYLLLFSPDKGEPHEYVQILEQQRCVNKERYVDRLKQTHADVQPYSLEHLRKGSELLINVHLQVEGYEADYGVLTRVEGISTFGKYKCKRSRGYHRGTNLAQVGRKADRAHIAVGAAVIAGQRITSSAWKRSSGGILRPSSFAVLRLMTNSNFVGCSTGRSPGLAPFRILST